MAQRRTPNRGRPYTPFKPPTRPPASFYDIGLDQQLAAATRGNQDQHQDLETAAQRGSQDFATGTQRLAQQRDQSLGDILLARSRGEENWAQRSNDLSTSYTNLAASQRDRANAAGIYGSSGWDAGAAGVRKANQFHDQKLLDTDIERQRADSATAESRLTDPNTGAYANSLADLILGHTRQGEDAATQGSATRFAQATQAGWIPPQKPGNENTIAGVTYRRLADGRAVLPGGRIVSRQGLRNLIARHR
jgi:hypothetical protein